MEKRGRPKTAENKGKITLSIDRDAISKAKQTAETLKKSLSQYTEDVYVDMHDSFFGLTKTPEERMKKIQRQLDEIQKVYTSKIKSEGDKE